jgi:hypothetical protein
MAINNVQTSRLAQSSDLTFRCKAALVVSELVPFSLRVQPSGRDVL